MYVKKIQSVLSLFKNRKNFFNNHPEAYHFMKNDFGKKQVTGTKISISVCMPDGQKNKVSITLDEADMPFMDAVTNLLNEKEQ